MFTPDKRALCFKQIAYMLALIFVIHVFYPHIVFASTEPDIDAEAAIVMEKTTGKILYQKDIHKKLNPASITKVLTAMVLLDYFDPDDKITIGNEINEIPYDSSRARHESGEIILVKNLVRALIIPSGNDSGNVAARAVIRKITGNYQASYLDEQIQFSQLMNDKAKSLGATDSNFVNPHGYYDERHYSTAYDLAMICKGAMDYELIRQVVSERGFEGYGSGELAEGEKTQLYSWESHNLLIMEGVYRYPYALGIKTGLTDDDDKCLASYAVKQDKKLIAVVLKVGDPARWLNSSAILDYGFDNFNFVELSNAGEIAGAAALDNQKLGDPSTVNIYVKDSYTDLLSDEQAVMVVKTLSFDEKYEYLSDSQELLPGILTTLKAPFDKDTVVGKMTLTLGSQVIFESDLLVQDAVAARSTESDLNYYFNLYKNAVFSFKAIPYWIGAGLGLFLLIWIKLSISARKKKKSRYLYKRY